MCVLKTVNKYTRKKERKKHLVDKIQKQKTYHYQNKIQIQTKNNRTSIHQSRTHCDSLQFKYRTTD